MVQKKRTSKRWPDLSLSNVLLFKLVIGLYDAKAVAYSLSLMLNAEVMKPFVVVERLFLHGHSDEGITECSKYRDFCLAGCQANFR